MKITLPRLRWIIAALLLLVTLINYADRGTLGVLKDEVCRDLNLTEIDYSHLVSVFFVAYAVMYAASGCVVDWIGARWSMALFVCLWSISQMCHGLATGKWSFAACRVGLGLAEPGSFPAATKAIGEWFAPRQRALAVGIFNAGAVLGIALTPPLAAWLALHYGWRAAFLVTGALGIVWILAWLAFYDSPGRHRLLKPIETDGVKATEPVTKNGPEQTVSRRMGALEVVSSRPGSLLIAARFLTDPVIYFMIFWLPAYLEKERGFDLKMIGQYAWVPYLFGGAGYLVGGWLSGRLIRRGWSVSRARKTAMAMGAALMPAAILAPLVPTWQLAIAANCFIVLGHAIWVSNLMTLPTDLFSPREVGTAAGFSGMGGAIGGALANWFTGSVIAHFSYLPLFIAAGLLHPTALLLLWRLLPDRCFVEPPRRG